MRIQDGTGGSKLARVNDDHRLGVDSVSASKIHDISQEKGSVYIFTTAGFISISTTGTEHGMFYLRNDSSSDLFIHSIRTCGNQIQKIKIYKDVTGGTLVTGAVAGGSENLNHTSSMSASATIYKGANGNTVVGTLAGQHINGVGHSDEQFDGAMILGKDDTIAITCEMAVAGDFCIKVIGYYE